MKKIIMMSLIVLFGNALDAMLKARSGSPLNTKSMQMKTASVIKTRNCGGFKYRNNFTSTHVESFFKCLPDRPKDALAIIYSVEGSAIKEFKEVLAQKDKEAVKTITQMHFKMNDLAEEIDKLNEEFYAIKREKDLLRKTQIVFGSGLLILKEKQKNELAKITGLDQR